MSMNSGPVGAASGDADSFAGTGTATAPPPAGATLPRGEIGLLGVLMPGLAQVAPAFNLFFTTGLMAAFAGASVPLVFLISMVGLIATAASLALFSGVFPSAGSFLTYIARSMGVRTSVVVGVITLLGYIIAFGGIYIFVGQYIVQNVLNDPHIWGITQIVTILYGVLVVAPVVLGLKFGVRTTVVLYVFEVVLLLALAIAVLAKGGAQGLSATPFHWPGGSGTKDIFIAFSLAVLAFGGFEAAAPLAEETRNPRRNVPLAVIGTVVISGILYVFCSYALIIAFGPGHIGALVADPNPFHTAATAVHLAAGPAHHLDLPDQRDQLVRGREHPDRPGHLRRGPGRAVGQEPGLGQPAVPHPVGRGHRVRGAQHRDRGHLDRVHRSGHGRGPAQHVRDPRPGAHVPDGQHRAHRPVDPVPAGGGAQERMGLGGHPGHRRPGAGHPDLG